MIIKNLPFDEYRSMPQVNFSTLKFMAQSPKHYLYNLENPKEPTIAMALGNLIHCIVLEPLEVLNRYAIMPDIDRRTKIGKEKYEEFINKSIGKIAIKDEQYKEAFAIAQTVPRLYELTTETTFTGILENIDVKCRVDAYDIDNENKVITVYDLKTTREASESKFKWSIENYYYHVQAAFYVNIMRQQKEFSGYNIKYQIIAVETQTPYDYTNWDLGYMAIDVGREIYTSWLLKVNEANFSNVYQGYPKEPIVFHPKENNYGR